MKANRHQAMAQNSTNGTKPQIQPSSESRTAVATNWDKSGQPFDPDEEHPSCLCIYDRLAKAPVSKIPISATEFWKLLAIAPGYELEEFIADAIRQKLARTPGADMAKPSSDQDDLDKAVAEMFRLIEQVRWDAAKSQVLIMSMLNFLENCCEDGQPSEAYLVDTWRGFVEIERALENPRMDTCQALLSAWRRISPELTRLMACEMDRGSLKAA